MDLGTPLWGVQDDSMEGGGRERLEHVLEIERLRRQSRTIIAQCFQRFAGYRIKSGMTL